ncbi:MAG: hypothetical protein LQ351_001115 [Letrouitia transgressa]|nr:MAG: hypothetical protein LQ351_001115 [Letrouitia transgressa]
MADTTYTPIDPPPSYETAAQPITTTSAPKPPKPPLPLPRPLELPLIASLRNQKVILASASPRRKQLLAQIGLTNLTIIPSTVPEAFPKSLSPFEYVLQTATQKAMTVYRAQIDTHPGDDAAAAAAAAEQPPLALVIAADTVVVAASGQILEKPRSEADHIAMLRGLRDSGVHRVYTAVVVMAPLASARDPGYALESTVEETSVRFARDTSDETILAYVRTREGADKAGGYGIQGVGAILVERIEGSFDNVVGLPLRPTVALMEKVLRDDEELEDEFAEAEAEAEDAY